VRTENRNLKLGAEFLRLPRRQLESARAAAHKNLFQMYPCASLWQDSILRKQVKISTCPCAENLPVRTVLAISKRRMKF